MVKLLQLNFLLLLLFQQLRMRVTLIDTLMVIVIVMKLPKKLGFMEHLVPELKCLPRCQDLRGNKVELRKTEGLRGKKISVLNGAKINTIILARRRMHAVKFSLRKNATIVS